MKQDRVAVFIASSDNTFDVLQAVYPSVRRCWSGVTIPFAVGLNERIFPQPDVTTLRSPVAGWRAELAFQLQQLQAERVILLLDDFLFIQNVDADRLMALVDEATREDIGYLRLVPPDGSCFARWMRALPRPGASLFQEISAEQPYFSSLQVALWKREYLLRCLNRAGSIWDFEHQLEDGQRHYAVRHHALFYRHVVEKGKWLAEAPALFRRAQIPFSPGNRRQWPRHSILSRKLQRFRFELFGYSVMRLRRWLARKPRNGISP